MVHYISSGRGWDAIPVSPKTLCPISEEDMKQRSAGEVDQRSDMFVVDRDQQRYLLVNCRGAVLMQLPLQRILHGEDTEEDAEMGDDIHCGPSDQRDDQNMDQRDYQDDLPEDQDYYDQSNEDEEQPLDGSMESLEQFV